MKLKPYRFLGVLVSCIILSACAIAPSKPKSFASLGKFEQYQLNKATFRISFKGDPDMAQSTAEEIALLKAAKATIDAGYQYFHVLDEAKPQRPRRTVVYPDYPYGAYGPYGYGGFGRWSRYGYGGYGWPADPFYGATVYNLDPVEVSYTIVCSTTPSDQRDEFDARIILQSLGPKYHLNPDGSARPIEQPQPKTP